MESNEAQWSPMVSDEVLLQRSPIPMGPLVIPVEKSNGVLWGFQCNPLESNGIP